MSQRYFICEHCKNIIAYVDNKGVPVMCCGQKMTELIPNTVEAASEKHVPVYEIENNKIKVKVGSADHPMTDEHHIAWVSVETKQGHQRKIIENGSKPEVEFMLSEDDELIAVYAYCNLHGLWKA